MWCEHAFSGNRVVFESEGGVFVTSYGMTVPVNGGVPLIWEPGGGAGYLAVLWFAGGV